MEFNLQLVLAWFMAVVTVFIIRLAIEYAGKQFKPRDADGAAAAREMSILLRRVFWVVLAAITAGFMLAMLWTGWHPSASNVPVGRLNTGGSLSLPDKEGENKNEKRTADEIVSEGQDSLDDFRKNMLEKE